MRSLYYPKWANYFDYIPLLLRSLSQNWYHYFIYSIIGQIYPHSFGQIPPCIGHQLQWDRSPNRGLPRPQLSGNHWHTTNMGLHQIKHEHSRKCRWKMTLEYQIMAVSLDCIINNCYRLRIIMEPLPFWSVLYLDFSVFLTTKTLGSRSAQCLKMSQHHRQRNPRADQIA